MKVDEIKDLTVEQLTERLTAEGISKSRLDGAVSSTFLSDKGVFTHFSIAGEENFKHVLLHTANGEQISLSRLQARGFKPTEAQTEPTFKAAGDRAKKPGSLFMQTNFDVNPSLQGNQAAVLKKIIGKPFTAERVEYITMSYVEEGVYNEDDAKALLKTQPSYIVNVR